MPRFRVLTDSEVEAEDDTSAAEVVSAALQAAQPDIVVEVLSSNEVEVEVQTETG